MSSWLNTFEHGITGSKTGRLPHTYVNKRESSDVLKKYRTALGGSFGEIVVHNGQLEQSQITSHPPKKTRCAKEILLFRSLEIECLNYRSPTSGITEGESLLHTSKLECHYDDCEGLDCNHGRFKAVSDERRKILDGSEMFLPQLDCFRPR